jgi:hypothetical protein
MNDSTAPHPYRTDSRTFRADGAGIDTFRVTFRNPSPELRYALSGSTVTDAVTGEVLPVVRKNGLRLVAVHGVAVMIGMSKNMTLWGAVEGRMASMLAGTVVDQLAAPLSLPDVPAAARAIANRVGVDLSDTTPVLGRADLTADVIVPGEVEIALLLQGFGQLPLPRLEKTCTTRKGSTVPALVTWKNKRIALRIYDKRYGRPHCGDESPAVLRIERQWVPSRKPIIDAATHERLADEFSRLLRHWLMANVVVPADGGAICEHLIARVPPGALRERLVGRAMLFEHVGESAFKHQRAAVSSRLALMKVSLGPGTTRTSTVGVAPVIRMAIDAWEAAVVPTERGRP